MIRRIACVALVVNDYDEAIHYYRDKLGFILVEDRIDGARRWVLFSLSENSQTHIRLVKATNPDQSARVGNQTGGRVFLFLETDDLMRDFEAMKTRGVNFIEYPRKESFGLGVIFEDLYGNRWELVQPNSV